MLHDNESHYPVGEAVWIAAGIILLFAFGDMLVLLGLALAVAGVIAAFWSYRQVRREQHDGDLASVTQMRPTTVRPGLKTGQAQAPWQGPSAA